MSKHIRDKQHNVDEEYNDFWVIVCIILVTFLLGIDW